MSSLNDLPVELRYMIGNCLHFSVRSSMRCTDRFWREAVPFILEELEPIAKVGHNGMIATARNLSGKPINPGDWLEYCFYNSQYDTAAPRCVAIVPAYPPSPKSIGMALSFARSGYDVNFLVSPRTRLQPPDEDTLMRLWATFGGEMPPNVSGQA